jgi:Flp pilus assembly protein TadG
MSRQSGQALVEWGLSALVLMLFAFGLLAVGQIVGEDMAIRSAATQAAFAAARAPSASAAQRYGQAAAAEAVRGTQLQDLEVTIDSGSFQRGSTVTVTARGYVSLAAFPIISQLLGGRVLLTWQAHALIEPYRSRTVRQ